MPSADRAIVVGMQLRLAHLSRRGAVSLESSPRLADAVNAQLDGVQVGPVRECRANGRVRQLTPLSLLHGLGKATAGPRGVPQTLLHLAGWWPVLRYVWALEARATRHGMVSLRLSAETEEVRYHRRTLLSEDFGIAAAAYLLEEDLGVPRLLDADQDLDRLVAAGELSVGDGRRPDFLARSADGSTWLVVEAKGCSGSRSQMAGVLAGGVAQATNVWSPGRPCRQLVVGAIAARGERSLAFQAVEVLWREDDAGEREDADGAEGPNGADGSSDAQGPRDGDAPPRDDRASDGDDPDAGATARLVRDLGRARALAFAGVFAEASRRRGDAAEEVAEPPRTEVLVAEGVRACGVTVPVAVAPGVTIEAFFGLDAALEQAYRVADDPCEEEADARRRLATIVREREQRQSDAAEGAGDAAAAERPEALNRYATWMPAERAVCSLCTDGTFVRIRLGD